jgi:hypothetical protein
MFSVMNCCHWVCYTECHYAECHYTMRSQTTAASSLPAHPVPILTVTVNFKVLSLQKNVNVLGMSELIKF